MYGEKPKKQLTFQNILKVVSEYDIFKYYCKNFIKTGDKFCSDLRKDNNPSCIISHMDKGLIYKDFATGDFYNCFTFVQKKFSCDFKSSLIKVSKDFNLDFHVKEHNYKPSMGVFGNVSNVKIKKEKKSYTTINLNVRKWNKKDAKFWKQFFISKKTLEFFNVFPLNNYCINNNWFYFNDLCYAYKFGYDTKTKRKIIKIYRPYHDKFKWSSNINKKVIEGGKQLPKKCDLLILTSSLKDVMCLYELGYYAVAPASESCVLEEDEINKLKNISSKIVLLFDNDEAGVSFSKKYSDKYGFKILLIPKKYNAKDPSDFLKLHKDRNKLKSIINNQL